MNKKSVKEAFESAEKELNDNHIEELKEVIKATLLKIKKLDEDIKDLQDTRKILKLDIDDYKEGRLDRIEERQKKDKKAKEVSVAEVVKKEVHHHHHHDRWYNPYIITWVERFAPKYIPDNTFYCSTTTSPLKNFCSDKGATLTTNPVVGSAFTMNCSTAKNNVIGTYLLEDKTVHLR